MPSTVFLACIFPFHINREKKSIPRPWALLRCWAGTIGKMITLHPDMEYGIRKRVWGWDRKWYVLSITHCAWSTCQNIQEVGAWRWGSEVRLGWHKEWLGINCCGRATGENYHERTGYLLQWEKRARDLMHGVLNLHIARTSHRDTGLSSPRLLFKTTPTTVPPHHSSIFSTPRAWWISLSSHFQYSDWPLSQGRTGVWVPWLICWGVFSDFPDSGPWWRKMIWGKVAACLTHAGIFIPYVGPTNQHNYLWTRKQQGFPITLPLPSCIYKCHHILLCHPLYQSWYARFCCSSKLKSQWEIWCCTFNEWCGCLWITVLWDPGYPSIPQP